MRVHDSCICFDFLSYSAIVAPCHETSNRSTNMEINVYTML